MRERPGDPCIMVIFGASGDLTKRLLMPAIYNLACDKLLPERLAIVGLAMDEHTTESFRDKVSQDIRVFSTRREFDAEVWGAARSASLLHSGKIRRTSCLRGFSNPGEAARRGVSGRG